MLNLSKHVQIRIYKKYFGKTETPCKCTHSRICHYTKQGNCVYETCLCKEFEPKGRQPFQNKRARCEYGHAHDSGLEIKTCFELSCEKRGGEISDFDAQKVVDLLGPSGAIIGTYKVDFVAYHFDGRTEWIECKGAHLQREGQWPLKWKLLQDKYAGDPKHIFRLVIG